VPARPLSPSLGARRHGITQGLHGGERRGRGLGHFAGGRHQTVGGVSGLFGCGRHLVIGRTGHDRRIADRQPTGLDPCPDRRERRAEGLAPEFDAFPDFDGHILQQAHGFAEAASAFDQASEPVDQFSGSEDQAREILSNLVYERS